MNHVYENNKLWKYEIFTMPQTYTSQKKMISDQNWPPTIGTLGRGHSTRTCVLVVKREFWFYRAAMCSHEGRSCRVRDFFEFTWHSFTWIKIILWQIIVIMKVDGQYYFIFLIWSVDYYSILSLSTLQPTMRCFRIPCIPFLFWPAWLCRNLCLLIS